MPPCCCFVTTDTDQFQSSGPSALCLHVHTLETESHDATSSVSCQVWNRVHFPTAASRSSLQVDQREEWRSRSQPSSLAHAGFKLVCANLCRETMLPIASLFLIVILFLCFDWLLSSFAPVLVGVWLAHHAIVANRSEEMSFFEWFSPSHMRSLVLQNTLAMHGPVNELFHVFCIFGAIALVGPACRTVSEKVRLPCVPLRCFMTKIIWHLTRPVFIVDGPPWYRIQEIGQLWVWSWTCVLPTEISCSVNLPLSLFQQTDLFLSCSVSSSMSNSSPLTSSRATFRWTWRSGHGSSPPSSSQWLSTSQLLSVKHGVL